LRYAQRKRSSPFAKEYQILSADPAIRTYFSELSTPQKPVSERQKRRVMSTCMVFLGRLGLPVTPTAISDLVQRKADNPRDLSIEKFLKEWRAETNGKQDNRISQVIGIYHRNMARLSMTIHCSRGNRTTIPIKESILRAIYDESDQETKDTILLQCYGGERYSALNLLPLENVHLVEDSSVAILDVPPYLAKTGIRHPSIIPKPLAVRILERAVRSDYAVLNPRYNTIWDRISQHSKSTHNVQLTSHYFRKRFETIAKRIPSDEMNPNHWTILMGSKPTLGHMPDVYSLLTNSELIQEYETHLMPRLALSGETVKPQSNQLEQLKRENAELKEQLLKLAKLITERA
jgi:hypothetical protein